MKIKIFVFALISIAFIGCVSTDDSYVNDNEYSNEAVMKSGFNEETYIWENWIFPSNKTTGK